MNSKAIRKQLLAAVAMVLVAAVALGSSTYAWFVASGTVTAEGMKVQAMSEAGLVIRYGTGAWGTSATADMTESVKLKPASTKDSKTWSYASAELASAYGAKNDTRKTIASANYSDHFLMKEFQIRSSSASTNVTGLYAKSVTVTGYGDKPMNTALRVGVAYTKDSNGAISGDQVDKFVIFAPVKLDETEANKPSYTYKFYANKDAEGVDVTALANKGTAENANLVKAGVSIPNAETSCVKVQIYVWYEGEDHNLYSDNYTAMDLSVSVDFASISDAASDAAAAEAAARDLTNASATSTGAKTVESKTYYPITGKALNGVQLYADAEGQITSTTKIYTLTIAENGDASDPQEVTSQCTMPAPPAQNEGEGGGG